MVERTDYQKFRRRKFRRQKFRRQNFRRRKFRRQKFRRRWLRFINRRIFSNLIGIVLSLSHNNYWVLLIILIIIDNCAIIAIIDYMYF